MVEAVRLARLEHVQPDADLPEPVLPALERALRAGRLLLAVLRREPLRVAHVHDEPTLARRCEAGAEILERRLRHGRESSL